MEGLIGFTEKSIHICRNVVKVTRTSSSKPKTTPLGTGTCTFPGNGQPAEKNTALPGGTELHEGRELTPEDYIFRRHGENLPTDPSTYLAI